MQYLGDSMNHLPNNLKKLDLYLRNNNLGDKEENIK